MLAPACGGDDDPSDHDDDGEHNDQHGEHHDEHGDADVGPSSGAVCPDESTLSYASFAKDFVAKYCLRCHSSKVKGDARNMAPPDHNFDIIEEIELLAKHIDQRAAAGPDSVNATMPLGDPQPTRKNGRSWVSGWPATCRNEPHVRGVDPELHR